MFTITKEFAFSASHALLGLPEGHKCRRMHGHNYVVVVELSAQLNEYGFVVDFGDLGWFRQLLDDEFDHRHLNEHPGFHTIPPTAEHLARYLFGVLHEQYGWKATAVRVSETPKTWAEYRRQPL